MLTIEAPSSKSVSHRTLMGAALAHGISEVRRVLMSKDIERTMAILAAAGARFDPLGKDGFSVQGMNGTPQGSLPPLPPLSCDVHESGTTCRLMTAILAAGQGRFRIHGAPRMHERPVGQLVTALQALGVKVSFEGQDQCPPLVLDTQGFSGSSVSIALDESSQYLSGLLLAAPLAQKAITITIAGEKIVSWPYVGLTLQCMHDFGIDFSVEILDTSGVWSSAQWKKMQQVQPDKVRFCIQPGAYQAGEYTVEGDWSGASYFLAAGAVGTRPLCVTGLRRESLQGDRAFVDILQRMGARVEQTPHSTTVYPSLLRGIEVDMGHCPDLVPTVAVLAAFAEGRTTVTNVAHLRIKESDRIAAPAAELRKMGISVQEHDDGLSVQGMGPNGPLSPRSTLFEAHGDHRIAMALALLGVRYGLMVCVDEPTVVGKSFPHFWDLWQTVVA